MKNRQNGQRILFIFLLQILVCRLPTAEAQFSVVDETCNKITRRTARYLEYTNGMNNADQLILLNSMLSQHTAHNRFPYSFTLARTHTVQHRNAHTQAIARYASIVFPVPFQLVLCSTLLLNRCRRIYVWVSEATLLATSGISMLYMNTEQRTRTHTHDQFSALHWPPKIQVVEKGNVLSMATALVWSWKSARERIESVEESIVAKHASVRKQMNFCLANEQSIVQILLSFSY